MVIRGLVHVIRVVHACVQAVKAVAISTAIRVGWIRAVTVSSATAALAIQVTQQLNDNFYRALLWDLLIGRITSLVRPSVRPSVCLSHMSLNSKTKRRHNQNWCDLFLGHD